MYHRSLRSAAAVIALLICAALGLAACGTSSTVTLGSSGSQPTSTPTATPSKTGGSPTTSGSTTPGQVTLSLDKGQYTVTDPIVVTIHNGLTTTISAADHQSNCTLVTLQQQLGSGWQPVGRCLKMIATRIVPIAAGASTPQLLAPSGGMAQNEWPAGTYRIVFTFSTGSGAGAGAAATDGAAPITSATFTVS